MSQDVKNKGHKTRRRFITVACKEVTLWNIHVMNAFKCVVSTTEQYEKITYHTQGCTVGKFAGKSDK